MHSWFLLLLLGCVLLNVTGRPQQAEYNNDSDIEESEEEDETEPVADAYSADDDDSRINDKETASQEGARSRQLLDLTERRYMHNDPAVHAARARSNSLSNINVNRNREIRDENQSEPANYNEQPRSFPKRRQSSNRYNEANDEQQETQQHMTNRDVSKSNHVQNPNDNQVNKRTLEYATANEEGDMIFEKTKDQAKNEYNANEGPDAEPSRYMKQYYNTMQAENKDIVDEKTREGARYKLRDRRETKEENLPEDTNMPNSQSTEINDKTVSEDEESAIKRHIKKLSSDELNQLLNSLTEEKRELLKKLIDDSERSDNLFVNKREITKKAGAVEENNYIENCQSDLSKIQGDSASLELNTDSPSSASTEPTEVSSKQQDSQFDISEATDKTSESSLTSANKMDLPSQNDEALQKKTDSNLNAYNLNDPKNEADIVASVQVTSSKTENKREVNLDELEEADDSLEDNKASAQDYSNDQGYINSQEENLSNIIDEESHPNEKNYKREAFYDKQSELSDSVKSLEESFPHSNAYDDLGSYSGPLIRVKRKSYDPVIKKRSAGLLPDAKVAYFPYKAENEDEDNDEGNEFDDEGFYDRTSNFANMNKGLEDNVADNVDDSMRVKNSEDASKSSNENLDSNTSLGSDSDSVLSGVEGVDDNLMYSSGTRSRRTAEDNSSDITQTKLKDRSTLLTEEESEPVRHQEHDAFGPLPRNSDGGLVRYKRIRRVKELHNPQELNSPGTE